MEKKITVSKLDRSFFLFFPFIIILIFHCGTSKTVFPLTAAVVSSSHPPPCVCACVCTARARSTWDRSCGDGGELGEISGCPSSPYTRHHRRDRPHHPAALPRDWIPNVIGRACDTIKNSDEKLRARFGRERGEKPYGGKRALTPAVFRHGIRRKANNLARAFSPQT